MTYQEDSLEKEEDEDPEMPAWGASRSVKNYLWEFSFSINSSYRPPLRGAQPLASLQVGRQPTRHGLVRCFFHEEYLKKEGVLRF